MVLVILKLKGNNNTSTISAAFFSIILILTGSVAGLPLLQQQLQQRQAYASTQEQRPLSQVPPALSPPSSQSLQSPSMPICNPQSSTLQYGSTGPNVAELQRILTQLGYGRLLGQDGIDGKFKTFTQNAVIKFQQDNRIQVDGKVGPITWRALCYRLTLLSPSSSPPSSTTTSPTTPTTPANQQGQQTQQQQQQQQRAVGCTTTRPIPVNLYNAFIHNPNTSTLDLLPGGLGEKYKNFNWDVYDYPGINKGDPGAGPNEKMAHEMFSALTKIACEHRPIDPRALNKNGQPLPLASTAVAKKDALNPYLNPTMGKYVLDQIIPAQGGNKLNKYAAESFAKMYAVAKADNVDLIILNSDRSCAAANARAGQIGNAFAVASCPNSHTIGLAIDFKMIPGPYQKGKELNTKPMKNIVDFYQTPTHKWLFLNAQKYGWYPYSYEPWHWEYNPDNFRSTFFSQYKQFLANHEQQQQQQPGQF